MSRMGPPEDPAARLLAATVIRARAAIFSCLLAIAAGHCAQAGESAGIVLMHGKNGHPGSMQSLVDALEAAGYNVDRPEMCWSRRRIYDRPYLECLRDADAAVERLRNRGAARIIAAGQSLGANAALAFAATRDGLAGVIAMAPAHNPVQITRLPAVARSLAEARSLIARGEGDVRFPFTDVNIGREFSVRTTPGIYLSFFAPEGSADIPANAARVRVPLLWIAGDADPTQSGPQHAFVRARNPANRYVTVAADHLGTPAASSGAILDWLRGLGGR
jgi:pimeloyl-ACP methyl ester carboxylesterase